ncbi:unnamed protein product, partial [Effrenium voratum]
AAPTWRGDRLRGDLRGVLPEATALQVPRAVPLLLCGRDRLRGSRQRVGQRGR